MNPGERLGSLIIEAEIGRGRFSVVYRARDLAAGESPRAVKVLRLEERDDVETERLFVREAEILQALQSLDSPHVCKLFDVGKTPDGRPYISMELLEGQTLAQQLARQPLPLPLALEHMCQLCDALQAVHRHGFVHRDLKPANVFVLAGARTQLKLLDFNIAKAGRPLVGTTLSHRDLGPGTDRYMSPEQILEPGTIDSTTDLWAAGVVLYEMVTGRPPFDGPTQGAIHVAIVNGERAVLPEAVQVLEPILARCLTDRGERYASAEALRDHVIQLVSSGAHLRPAVGKARAKPARASTRGAAVRLRDAFARGWIYPSLAMFTVGLSLLLGSYAVHPQLNELHLGPKQVGYIDSINWTLVHVFLGPLSLAFLGRFFAAARQTFAELGGKTEEAWDRRATRIALAAAALASLFALGYTFVEWRSVSTGHCDEGELLGWPNELCRVAGHALASRIFLYVAQLAQAAVLVVPWIWFCAVIAAGEVVFSDAGALRTKAELQAVAHLFETASWGWASQLLSLYLARLWSFHLQTAGTVDILHTLALGLPRSLLEIRAHSQPEVGSMIAGAVILVLGGAPFVALRLRGAALGHRVRLEPLHRPMLAFGAVGLVAMALPRLGAYALVLLLVVLVARSAARGHTPPGS